MRAKIPFNIKNGAICPKNTFVVVKVFYFCAKYKKGFKLLLKIEIIEKTYHIFYYFYFYKTT